MTCPKSREIRPSREAFDLRCSASPQHERRRWRCNFDRTANIATRISRPVRRKRASAAMNAHSARTASTTSSIMYARTAAAVSLRDRSGRPHPGVPAYAPRRIHHRTNASISNSVLTTSPNIQPASRKFAPKIADLLTSPAKSCPRLRQSRHDSHYPGTSRASPVNRRPPEMSV
jgi:hypothetical protein